MENIEDGQQSWSAEPARARHESRSSVGEVPRRAPEGDSAAAARLDALMTSAPVGFAFLDTELRYELINDHLAKLNGAPASEHIGRTVAEMRPLLAPHVLPVLRRVLDHGERIDNAELASADHFDGDERYYLASYFPVDIAGRRIGVGVTIVDITDRHHLLAEARAARDEAERIRLSLEQLQEISDAALASLSLEDLLAQLMPRLGSVVDAEVVRILLLSPNGRYLTVEGSFGVSIDVDHVVPVGEGFAGHVASQRQPLVIDHTESAHMLTAELQARGLGSSAGVPIMVGERLVGVLHVGSLRRRRFGREAVELLTLAAERIGVAIDRARAFEVEHRARERADFMAVVNDALSSHVSVQDMARTVAQAAVPRLGDWCAVVIAAADGRQAPLIEIGHWDPDREEWARQFVAQFEWQPDALRGVPAVLRTGRPELVEHVPLELIDEAIADDERLAPLRELQLSSVLVVPMRVGDRVTGALQMVKAESGGRYIFDDVLLAQDIADRVAAALENARLSEEQRHLLATLQRSLLPDVLCEVPGVELAARYRPTSGGEVGGDFYDVKPLPGREWLITIGDVSGKGIAAAATTALARYTLAAVAPSVPSPSDALRRLHQELGARGTPYFCTALAAILRPEPDGNAAVRFSVAGHPLPVLVRRGGSPQFVGSHGNPLGLVPDVRLHDTELILGAGDTLVLYTDGATDVPPPGTVDDAALLSLVGRAIARGSEATADRLLRLLARAHAGARQLDDLAFVVVQVPRVDGP